jgi:hypothetical protein
VVIIDLQKIKPEIRIQIWLDFFFEKF